MAAPRVADRGKGGEAAREALAAEGECGTWSEWQDSNLRPPAPEAGALTKLRYTQMNLAVVMGFDPTTSALTGPRSPD